MPQPSQEKFIPFLLSNYQFLIIQKHSESYFQEPVSNRLDSLEFSWKQIGAIVWHISQSENKCSICLEAFVVPRASTCGHVFCLICIIKHVISNGCRKQVVSCPVCLFRHVVPSDLIPVQLFATEYTDSPDISCKRFHLILRNKSTAQLFTRDCFDNFAHNMSSILPLQGTAAAKHTRYARLDVRLYLDYLCIEDQLLREMEENCEETKKLALACIDEQRAKIQAYIRMEHEQAHLRYATRDASSDINDVSAQKKTNIYVLYKQDPVNRVFLDPLNVRMLHFEVTRNTTPQQNTIIEDVHLLPEYIEVPVFFYETIFQTVATKMRYKTFSHIPLGTVYYMAVVDLSNYVSKRTMDEFSSVLNERIQRMRLKEANENRRLQKQQKELELNWKERELKIASDFTAKETVDFFFHDDDFPAFSQKENKYIDAHNNYLLAVNNATVQDNSKCTWKLKDDVNHCVGTSQHNVPQYNQLGFSVRPHNNTKNPQKTYDEKLDDNVVADWDSNTVQLSHYLTNPSIKKKKVRKK